MIFRHTSTAFYPIFLAGPAGQLYIRGGALWVREWVIEFTPLVGVSEVMVVVVTQSSHILGFDLALFLLSSLSARSTHRNLLAKQVTFQSEALQPCNDNVMM